MKRLLLLTPCAMLVSLSLSACAAAQASGAPSLAKRPVEGRFDVAPPVVAVTPPGPLPADLAGRRVVLAAWGPECANCAGYAEDLEPLAARLAARGEVLVGVWLGEDPAAAGPPRRYAILVPEDPESARRRLAIDSLPLLAVVDAKGLIRYRHAGRRAVPPPVDDIVIQLDHLARSGR